MVTSRTQELIEKDTAHHIHFFGEIGVPTKVIWERGEGVRLWDIDGKQYIDISSGTAQFASLGHARKELVDAAYEQMKKISHIGTQPPYSTIPTIEYAAELAKVLPGNINHVLFTVSGTGSNEGAIRTAKLYWHVRGQGSKYKVICLSNAYHGGSHLCASLTGPELFPRVPFGPEALGIVRIPNYHCYRCQFGLKYPDCGIRCAHFLEQVIEAEGEDSIAAFIAEPVQGAAGVIWPPNEYWPIVRQICSQHNILLITDCVQNGFCRTGKFWGVDNWTIVPDIMTLGKGINGGYLPLGAIALSDKVHETLSGKIPAGGATHSGNPVLMATARAALKIYIEEKLAERSAKLGEHIHERLVKEFLPLPCVDDIMGRGCYQSFEIALGKTTGHEVSLKEQGKVAASIMTQLLEGGLLPPVMHANRLTVTPPLIINDEELDVGLETMLSVMKDVKPV